MEIDMRRRRTTRAQRDLTQQQAKRADQQRRQARAERPAVDKVVASLKAHLAENSFADRLYQQMDASRRQP